MSTDTYEEARNKLPEAADDSSLESEGEQGRGKRKKKLSAVMRRDPDSDDEDKNDEIGRPSAPKLTRPIKPKERPLPQRPLIHYNSVLRANRAALQERLAKFKVGFRTQTFTSNRAMETQSAGRPMQLNHSTGQF